MSYIKIPEILLPKKEIDYEKWAVIACDQFTSQIEYWKHLEDKVLDKPSTLNLILPEAYLESGIEKKIKRINSTMKEYLRSDIFDTYKGFVYIEREISEGVIRKGLVILVDLEAYDYSPSAKLPIRATEKTVKERLPVRVKIRLNAPLELPHICIFMDDRNDNILSKLSSNKDKMQKLYDFDLNMKGGHIEGYFVDNSLEVQKEIDALLDKELLKAKYNSDQELLFVVGDGNHSLAAAKECWEIIKKSLSEEQITTHPARFALCELQNVHDKAIEFEPIHRHLLSVDNADFIEYLKNTVHGDGKIIVITDKKKITINCDIDPTTAIAHIQMAIDSYMEKNKDVKIDYIHGDDYLEQIIDRFGGVGIMMPKVEKSSLFDFVCNYGVMPRKSFSMGHAESKRYYIEAHKIR